MGIPKKDTILAEWYVAMRRHGLFLLIIGSYCVVVRLVGSYYGVADAIVLNLYSADLIDNLKWFCLVFLLGHTFYVMVIVRPRRLVLFLWNDWRYKVLQPRRCCNAALVLIALPLFMSAFSSLKSVIPVLNPYLWDSTFNDVDYFLHLGHLPWHFFIPCLQQPLISFVINFNYNIWVFILPAVLLWQTFSLQNERLRMQFMLSYLLVWIILGSLVATFFASVGPCYYGNVVAGSNPYLGLMHYLMESQKQYPMWALEMQDVLWQGYQTGEVTRGSGVSAMPSLHVATSLLMALLGMKSNRIMGILLSVFCGVVFLGSVYLGWHYAIDGYVALLGTVLIWKGVGWGLGRWWAENAGAESM